MSMPQVYILLLNWNSYADTAKCLRSLKKIDFKNFKVIVVDNGSKDKSAERVEKEFNDIILIKNNKNLGFAEGNNIAIRYALKEGADYVYLLNNDTEVEKNVLNELVKVAESDEKIGMVGSKIYFMDKPDIISYAGGVMNLPLGWSHHIGNGEKDRSQYDQKREVGFITACSLLVKKSVIDKIGLMDAGYFAYAEEADWEIRARQAGFKLVYTPKAVIWHKFAGTTGGPSALTEYYDTRNGLYLFTKYNRGLYKIFASLLFLARKKYQILRMIIRNEKQIIKRARGILLGIKDYMKHRRGECSYEL